MVALILDEALALLIGALHGTTNKDMKGLAV
jgi:hypothetical protein